MSKSGVSFVLTVVVAGVIVGDNSLEGPWRYVVWGLGLCLPWVIMSRLLSPQLR